jgi:hypothetical protein
VKAIVIKNGRAKFDIKSRLVGYLFEFFSGKPISNPIPGQVALNKCRESAAQSHDPSGQPQPLLAIGIPQGHIGNVGYADGAALGQNPRALL